MPRFADLVCYFIEKAREEIEAKQAKRAGLLATNSIRGGANRKVIEQIKESGDVFMAWSDEPWILNSAAVRISIVGFDDGQQSARMLNGHHVMSINSDLTSSSDITTALPLAENADIAFMGMSKKGSFDIAGKLAREMLAQPANPNGYTNDEVIRRLYNGRSITGRWSDIWIIDFGTDRTLADAALFEAPFEYVLRVVRPERAQNNRKAYRERWWLQAEARPSA